MKRLLPIFCFVLCAFILLLIGIVNLRLTRNVDIRDGLGEVVSDEVTPNQKNQNHQVLTSLNVVSEGDNEFFVFKNGNPSDFFEGFESFGAMDKLGVDSAIINAHASEIADFWTIAGKKSDREQFLTSKGVVLTNEDRRWHVLIVMAVPVGADVRLSVSASVGNDVSENGGIQMGILGTVNEIWKLDPSGNQPVLLDRSMDYFEGVSTHAEIPPSDLTWPDGIQFGSP